ncbi:Putative uncharacterized protein [Escherichia coli D6-117.29]
MVVVW